MRILIFIALLCAAVQGRGQMYIDSYRFGESRLLLDEFPGADAAYSLRKLREAYTGNCIQVRRASDNTTSNIGFVSNYLDTTSLKTFCGTGSTDTCFIRTWYDQSGNARNATQTTNANQPFIWANNAFVTMYRKPAINFTNDWLEIGTQISITSQVSIIGLVRPDTTIKTGSAGIINYQSSPLDDPEIRLFAVNGKNILTYYNAGYTIQDSVTTIGDGVSFAYFIDSAGKSDFYRNNTALYTGTRSGALSAGVTEFTIGRYLRSSSNRNGIMSEFVVYLSNQISSVSNINSNINTFYSIY